MSTVVSTNLQSKAVATPPVIKDSAGTEVGRFCRAFVNFNGTGVVAINASFNVTSITDNGTGDYTVNFTAAFADANYCPVLGLSPAIGVSTSAGSWHGGVATDGSGVPLTKTTTALRLKMAVQAGPGALTDMPENNLAVFR